MLLLLVTAFSTKFYRKAQYQGFFSVYNRFFRLCLKALGEFRRICLFVTCLTPVVADSHLSRYTQVFCPSCYPLNPKFQTTHLYTPRHKFSLYIFSCNFTWFFQLR